MCLHMYICILRIPVPIHVEAKRQTQKNCRIMIHGQTAKICFFALSVKKQHMHTRAHTKKNVVSYFRKKRQGECMVYFQISVILPLKLKRSDARKLHSKNFLFIWSFTYFSPQFPGHIGKDIKNHSVRISAGLVSREISTSVSQFEVLQVHVL